MRKTLLFAALFAAAPAFAQTDNQKPYFQQDVGYTIKVSLDDKKHELHGFETLIYKNNSPDQLPFIYMHLWPNGYRDNNTALGKQLKEDGDLFFYYAKPEDRGYIDSLDFKVDGQSAKLEYDAENPDIAKLWLPIPLQPGGQISITTPFHVKIPSGKISRLGHIGQQYQITQWYPKPAVYDRNGWNQIPYLNQGEFYSEFGTYDVFISLPKNYVLGATGDLQDNPEEKKFMDDLAEQTKSISSYDKKDDKFPESSSEWKTVHYHQEHVHDFAWFCDKRYHVLKGEQELPHTKRKVTTWVMYTNQYAEYWKDAIDYVNKSLYYYSLWNGDYTYDVCTAVDGALSAGGGMEYPNITVIGAAGSARTLDIVITHEVGHNWFYGMLGSNERRHAWMDEGINSANEMRYTMTRYPNAMITGGARGTGILDLDRYKASQQYYQLYAFCARQNIDQPDDLPAAEYTSINYGAIVYMKSAVIFNYLRAYLGDSLYDKCFQTYFDRWHWKHPMPEDMKAVFVEVSGKNLDWLFEDLIKTNKKLDYKIKFSDVLDSHSAYAGQRVVLVKNTGEITGPFCVSAIKNGQVVQTIWHDGVPPGEQLASVMFPAGDYDKFIIDYPEMMPEVNRKNNRLSTTGLLRKTEPLKFQVLGSLPNPTRTQLFWSPALGFNLYDKFMLGAAFYNHVLPGKTFEWTVMPMYGFGSKTLVGHADAFFHIRPNSVFQEIRVGANANRYDYYTYPGEPYPVSVVNLPSTRRLAWLKVAPELSFDIKKGRARSPISQTVSFRAIWLQTDEVQWMTSETTPLVHWYEMKQVQRTFYEARYSFANNRHINPFDFTVLFQTGDNMNKLQVTGHYHININARKIIDIRAFGGTFLSTSVTDAGPYRFRMSGWGPLGLGNHDYLFDNIFIGRSEDNGFWAQQMVVEDGGFKIYSPYGQSDKWLAATNVTLPIPGKKRVFNMIKIYGDAGVYNTTGLGSTEFLFDAGIQLSLIRGDVCNVYFPLVYSKNIKDYYTSNGLNYGNMIRFTFNLKPLNPFRILQNVQI